MSADPVGPLNGGSTFGNRYSYVGYDPINFTDPSGFLIDQGAGVDCYSRPSDPACQEGDGGVVEEVFAAAAILIATGIVLVETYEERHEEGVEVGPNPYGEEGLSQEEGLGPQPTQREPTKRHLSLAAPGAPSQMFGPSDAVGLGFSPLPSLAERGALAAIPIPRRSGESPEEYRARVLEMQLNFNMMGPMGGVVTATRTAVQVGWGLVKRWLAKLGAPRAVPKVHMGQQGKHILGHNNFKQGRSVLTADAGELAKRAGTGTPVNKVPRGQPGFRERVQFDDVIGDFVKDGVATPTRNGIIHYGKEGIHIVPAAP
jgi:hypothetical protein